MTQMRSSEGKKQQSCASAGRGGMIPKKTTTTTCRCRGRISAPSSVLLLLLVLLSLSTNPVAVAWKAAPTSLITALASSPTVGEGEPPSLISDASDTNQNNTKKSSSSPIRRGRLKRKNLLQKTLVPLQPPESSSSIISPLVVPEPPKTTNKKNEKNSNLSWILCCLATLTGMSEAICFRRFGAFPNMMTGNTVRLCSFVSTGEFSKLPLPLSLIVSYVLGGALYQTVQIKEQQQSSKQQQQSTSAPAPLLYKVSKLAFGFFVLSDIMSFLSKSPRSSSLWLMSIAYGMINAATVAQLKTVTNAVTGHWQSIGIGLGDWMSSKDKRISKSSKTSALIVSCFVTSLLVTGWMMNWMVANNKLSLLLSNTLSKLPFATSFGGAYLLLFWFYSRKQKESLLL